MQVRAFRWLPIPLNLKATFDLQRAPCCGSDPGSLYSTRLLSCFCSKAMSFFQPQGLGTCGSFGRKCSSWSSRDLLLHNVHFLREALHDRSAQSSPPHSHSTLHHFTLSLTFYVSLIMIQTCSWFICLLAHCVSFPHFPIRMNSPQGQELLSLWLLFTVV